MIITPETRLITSGNLPSVMIPGSTVLSVGSTSAPVVVPVTSVTVTPSTATLTEGDTASLTVSYAPANATKKTGAWSTSDASIVTVSGTNTAGNIEAIAAGSATITFTSTDGAKNTCVITVEAAADLSAIDLTAPTLDSRVTYTGPSHTVIDADGNFVTSAANAWPVEYAGGVAVGRHEPEAAAINYCTDTSFTSVAATDNQATPTQWVTASGIVYSVDAQTPFAIYNASTASVNTGLYSVADGAFLPNSGQLENDPGESWGLVYRADTNDNASDLRWYTTRQSSGDYTYGIAPSVPAGNVVASVWRRLTDSNIQAMAPQVEVGTVPTSPIINDVTEQNTRAASSVTVTNPGGATGISVHYSDGTTATVSFDSDTATIPLASQAWASRYITQITFNS